MQIKRGISRLLCAGLMVLAPALTAQAEIYRFSFEAYTHREGATDTIQFYATVEDTSLRAPDAVASFTVTAPDGTVFDLTEDCWIDLSKQFWASYTKDKFKSKAFPSGNYVAKVVDKSVPAKTLTQTDSLTVGFLNPATITYPANGATGVPLTPTLKWNAVSGAKYYRVYVFNNSWGEPVYWKHPINTISVYRNSFTVPVGALMPNCQYRLCIEARDSDKNLSKRSRSAWITFTTAP
jgi:hypothetical protein